MPENKQMAPSNASSASAGAPRSTACTASELNTSVGTDRGSTSNTASIVPPRVPALSAAATQDSITSTAVPSTSVCSNVAMAAPPRLNCTATTGATSATGHNTSTHCTTMRVPISSARGTPLSSHWSSQLLCKSS